MLPPVDDTSLATMDPNELYTAWIAELPGDHGTTDGEITLAQVASLLAPSHPHLDPAGVGEELRDRLRIAMINGVVDINMVQAALDIDLSGDELRQQIEGSKPITLREYAHIRQAIASLKR